MKLNEISHYLKIYKYKIGEKWYDFPWWLISNCCGANIDGEKPFEYKTMVNGQPTPNLLYIREGICSKCNKKSEFYDKHYKFTY